jgi:hypothetical protein
MLRAQHHIDELNQGITEFVSNQPWSYAVEQDFVTRQDLHKIKFQRQLPIFLPCVLFDAVNNLRAALDQAGYASAVASGRQNPKRTNFPFADDLAGLDNNIDGRKVCADLPPEITALFRAFSPYKGGNDVLWSLNKLCNAKKHCALVPFAIGRAQLSATTYSPKPLSIMKRPDGAYDVSYAVRQTGFAGGMTGHNPDWDPDKYEITLAREPLYSNTQYDAHVALNIAVESVETLRRKPVVGALREMLNAVESVVGVTKSECGRLGFI